jgi:hypothetical protein
MNSLALQVLIVVAFGAVCFGCGYLTAFIVTLFFPGQVPLT